MTKRQYRQYAMLVRVRNFGDTHKEQFPEGSEGSKAFGVVSTAVTQIDAFTNAKLTARRLSKKEKLAAKLALAARIGAMARSARVMAKSVVGADAKFPPPTRQSDVAVLQTGRLFLEEAGAVKDAFIRCGLPATFLEELQQAVATLEQAIDGRSAGKADAVVAQKGIHSTLKKGIDAVASLDVLVANALGRDHDTMNAWKSDRHVELAGKNASVGAPSEQGVSMPTGPSGPSGTDEHLIPPATEQPSAQPSANHPPETPTGDAPLLQRAS
jgi:hypothetical protein